MGRFTQAVQSEDVAGPLRREFKARRWADAHARLGDDAADKRLFEAGLLVLQKADRIRASLKLTFSDEIRATTKIRAFAALVNYNSILIADKTQAAITEIAESQKLERPGVPVMMHDIAGVQLTMNYGAKFSPDEMIQSMVDGVQVPLKRILERRPDLSGNAEFGKLNLDDLQLDFSLGTLYSHVEGLWDDCLWNGYGPFRTEKGLVFYSEDRAWQVREVTSRVRANSLAREFAVHALNFQRSLQYQARLNELGQIDVKSVARDGRKQVLRMAPIEASSERANWLFTLRMHASEPYYVELLNEPQAGLSGSTLNHLLVAWTVVSSAAEFLMTEVRARPMTKADEPKTWLPGFAPVLQIKALTQAVSTANGTSLERSRALVEFLVFRGAPGDELWAQPLLPCSDETVIPLFATARSPNLRRLVDVWLKQLGVDMSLRGPAFEAYIRSSIRAYMAESPFLKDSSTCHQQALRFTPPEGREEEIDVVAVVGNVLLVGEAKCFLEPAEPRETGRHRDKVLDAVVQVKRKATAVALNAEAFRVRAEQVGLNLPQDFEVLPVVLLNSAFHCGVAVDGVPVVDEHILSVFFRGEFVEVAVGATDGGLSPVRKRVLYDSAEQGARALHSFLTAPAQMEPLLAGISERWVPVPPVDEQDWSGTFLALDCVPKVDLSSIEDELRQIPVSN